MNKLGDFIIHSLPTMLMCFAADLIVLVSLPLIGVKGYVAWYIAGLICFMMLVILFADFIRYRRRRLALRQLSEMSYDGADIEELLPEPYDALMRDCFTVIENIELERKVVQAKLDSERSDRLGYYTLWVHQIKTPISAMRMLLEAPKENTLLMKAELFKIESYADLALRYAKLAGIADDIVAENVELSRLVRDCVKKYAVHFILKKLTVSIDVPESNVICDRRWLEFIIEQLLDNAIKYTKVGRIAITLSDRTLSIADTGIGIMESDLPLVFQKGYTGLNGRVDSRASGIGLYLSKKASEAIGVGLKARSTLGKGSEFSIVFPEDTPLEFPHFTRL